MRFVRAKKVHSGLDMSPMIDCILQLLIFFMLTSSFSGGVIRLSLPRAPVAETSEQCEILISANAAGELFLGGQSVAMESLTECLRGEIARQPQANVVFRGDGGIPYSLFVEVTDRARQAGVQRYRIAHAPQDAPGHE